jgi:endonuclease/exonuclease/phosphatase family metal-dependent hydrolase
MHIRILEWNIWYKENIQNVIEFLKEQNADIICLQELTVGHELHGKENLPQRIADALGYSFYFVPAHTFPTGYQIGNGIFSRWPLAQHQYYFVQHAHEGPHGSEESRVYIQADILTPAGTLKVATTHLSYSATNEYSDQRKKEIAALTQELSNKTEKFVFTGDLNATPESYTVQEILQHLKNAGPDFVKPTWPTKQYTPGPDVTAELKHRLDYVFATSDVRIVASDTPLTGYSDHLPISVEIEL